MDTLSASFESVEHSKTFSFSAFSSQGGCGFSLSSSSQLRAALDGIRSIKAAFVAVTVGSAESSKPSRLRERFGVDGVLCEARGEMGVLEPLRGGY